MAQLSPFFDPGLRSRAGNLAIVHLSRENLEPIILQESAGAVDGYAEGAVLNTRFGSFPHSTLLGVPWGSQIRASAVDTGSRGRKRRHPATDDESKEATSELEDDTPGEKRVKKAVVASSGFVHILPPTPELWTTSLPHRTQVVYTPDYSYILQRIRARPGTRFIEAGAGSGSFTHAAARAVYNGYPSSKRDRRGKIFSFEFHEPRFQKMAEEIKAHGLDGIVELTQRDVYQDGFLVDGESPEATSVFLDLPAPWDALPHLSRRRPRTKSTENGSGAEAADAHDPWVSPLNPNQSVYICTFSPCIEQVMRTISALRCLGWVEVDMVEISHKKLNIVRERVGFAQQPDRGATQAPGDVGEAVARLKDIERRTKDYHSLVVSGALSGDGESRMDVDPEMDERSDNNIHGGESAAELSKPWLTGRLIHRSEPELKMHTSYLVFAILPREWSEDDEAAALARWPCGKEKKVIGDVDKATRKQEKRELLESKSKQKRGVQTAGNTAALSDKH